jgi:class 3 adenylate cyclase
MSRFRSFTCQPSLRAVIAAICCACTIGVGVTTLVVTYVLARRSLIDIGRQYAASLATSVSIKAEAFFDTPVTHVRALQTAMKREGVHLPSDDETLNASNVPYEQAYATVLFASNMTYPSVGIYYDDGGIYGVYPDANYTEISTRMTNQHWSKYHGTGRGNSTTVGYTVKDMKPVPQPPNYKFYLSAPDLRPDGWDLMTALALADASPLWLPMRAYRAGSQDAELGIPLIGAALNNSDVYMGVVALIMPFSELSAFLQSLPMTPNAAGFMFNDQGVVLGSSLHNVAITSVSAVPVGYDNTKANCLTTQDTVVQIDNWLVCATLASEMPYAPLQVAAADKAFMRGETTGVVAFKVNGETYYGVAPAVPNTARFFATVVAILVPEKDLTGDLNTARDVTIAICVSVVVVAALIAMVGVTVMLRPLRVIAERMGRTAKLQLQAREGVKYVESNLWEIQALQRAYEDMHTAVDSFTRYVPRDVVKDLMQTGQLCAIGVTATQCTMLFADIAGFTSICERVPAARLGEMITAFFETASQLVMTHGGLVDKFIGDCVMAVWGAPFACSSMQAKAALCALRMSHSTFVEPLAGIFDREGELLALRVGVNTGEVLAGNMGGAQRISYTVIGDAVNLAARLEGLNKKFGTRVLLSEFVVEPTTHAALSDIVVLRLVGRIRVAGKNSNAARVYEALGLTPDADDHGEGHDGPQAGLRFSLSDVRTAAAMDGSTASPRAAVDAPLYRDAASSSRAAATGARGGGGRRIEGVTILAADGTTHRSNGAAPARRRQAGFSLPRLLHDAMYSLRGPSMRCAASERAFCTAYSAACAHYCEGRPEACVAALTALTAAHPEYLCSDTLPLTPALFSRSQPSPACPIDAATIVAAEVVTEREEADAAAATARGATAHAPPALSFELLRLSAPLSARALMEECVLELRRGAASGDGFVNVASGGGGCAMEVL